MACPVCPAIGVVGGYLGGYFGIAAPANPTLRIASALITASTMAITIVAFKYAFGITFCDGLGNFSWRNIVQVSVLPALLGIIYSIAINYLFNCIFQEENKNNPSSANPCCCKQ